MKRLLQESEEEIMVTLGSSSRLSPDKKAETLCGIKSKSSGPAGTLPEDSFLPPHCGPVASATGGDTDGGLAQRCSFGQQASSQLPLGSTACVSGSASQ